MKPKKKIKQLYKNLEEVFKHVEKDPQTYYELNSSSNHVLSGYGLFTTTFKSVANTAPDVYTFDNPNETEKLVNLLFEPNGYWKDIVHRITWLEKCKVVLRYLKEESEKL